MTTAPIDSSAGPPADTATAAYRRVQGDPVLRDAVRMAADICGAPISLVTLLDPERQHFLAALGMAGEGTPIEQAFCRFAVAEPGQTMVVPDATADPRLAKNPLVLDDPKIRFYAGTPLVGPDGQGLGTLCVIDREPRTLSAAQLGALEALADQVNGYLEAATLRSRLSELEGSPASEGMPVAARAGLFVWGSDRTIRQASDGFADISGFTTPQLRGMQLDALLLDGRRFPPTSEQRSAARRYVVSRTPLRRADGAIRWVRVITSMRPTDHDAGLRVSQVTDLTDEHDGQADPATLSSADDRYWQTTIDRIEALAWRRDLPIPERLTKVLRATSDAVGWPVSHLMICPSPGLLASSGIWALPPDEPPDGGRFDDFVAATERLTLRQDAVQGLVRTSARSRRPVIRHDLPRDPTFLRADAAAKARIHSGCAVPILPQGSDKVVGVLELFSDETRHMGAAELGFLDVVTKVLGRIAEEGHQAMVDTLTGLANRFGVAADLALRTKRGRPVAVLVIDIDRFSEVNALRGQAGGDEVLVAFARELRDLISPSATVGRTSADEFVVLLSDVGEAAVDIADDLLERTRTLFRENGRGEVTSSIGVASDVGGETRDGDLLWSMAAQACRVAKSRGSNQVVTSSRTLYEEERRIRDLRRDLEGALERGELSFGLQPIVLLATGQVTGFEALLRWDSPEHGSIPPGRFVKWAEQSGAIHPIGAWLLEEVCQLGGRWRDERRQACSLSVNVSVAQLRDPGFPCLVSSLLEQTGFPPQSLILEITETTLLADTAEARSALGELRSLGVRLAVDDFGTGYSSLGYLQRLPVERLKIDRSFVTPLPRGGETITRTILSLARGLDLEVVAEGIETEAQRDWLARHDCRLGQGWLFDRALATEDAAAVLETTLGPPVIEMAAPPQMADAGLVAGLQEGPLRRLGAARLLLGSAVRDGETNPALHAGLAAVEEATLQLREVLEGQRVQPGLPPGGGS